MKKISLLINLTILLLLLSSCSTDPQISPLLETDNKELTLDKPLNIDDNSEISFFNNEKLYFFTSETVKKDTESANMNFYEYIFDQEKSNIINSFTDITFHTGSKTIIDDKLYFPLTQNNQNILLEIRMENKKTKTIKKWTSYPPFSYVFNTNNHIVLFGPNTPDNSKIEYSIDTLNLENNQENNIVKKIIKDGEGELISSIDVDGEYIFAFSTTIKNNKHEYSVIKYDLTGKEIIKYPFDLQSFFKTDKTLINKDDTIFSMYKEGNYFILNTLNGRIFIFKLIDNQLQAVKIPENYYEENPSGFHFMEYTDEESDFAYFYNSFEKNNEVTVFNYLTEEFTTIGFPKEETSLYEFFRNAKGDLIVKRTNNSSANDFFHFKREDLFEE